MDMVNAYAFCESVSKKTGSFVVVSMCGCVLYSSQLVLLEMFLCEALLVIDVEMIVFFA